MFHARHSSTPSMAPDTLLPLATFLLHSTQSVPAVIAISLHSYELFHFPSFPSAVPLSHASLTHLENSSSYILPTSISLIFPFFFFKELSVVCFDSLITFTPLLPLFSKILLFTHLILLLSLPPPQNLVFTFNTHDTKPRTIQQHSFQNAFHVGTGSRSVPTRCRLIISSRMTNGAICCMSEKGFPPTCYT